MLNAKFSRYVPIFKLSCRFSLFNRCSCFSFASVSSLCNLPLHLSQMSIKGWLLSLIVVALVVRSSTPIKWSCVPSGYKECQPFMTYLDTEDTGLHWLYMLYSPPRPKKLSRCQTSLKTRTLILILLAIGCIESQPGKF